MYLRIGLQSRFLTRGPKKAYRIRRKIKLNLTLLSLDIAQVRLKFQKKLSRSLSLSLYLFRFFGWSVANKGNGLCNGWPERPVECAKVSMEKCARAAWNLFHLFIFSYLFLLVSSIINFVKSSTWEFNAFELLAPNCQIFCQNLQQVCPCWPEHMRPTVRVLRNQPGRSGSPLPHELGTHLDCPLL